MPVTATQTIERWLIDKPLVFQPGTNAGYSGSGYIVLGKILENVTGQSYESYLRDNVFTPLEMKDSGVDNYSAVLKKRASGYVPAPEGLRNAPFIDMSAPFSAGGLYSTVEDLHRWDEALYTERLVSRASLERMFTANRGGYGYGWMVGSLLGRPAVSHAGSLEGFSTHIIHFRADHVGVIVLMNSWMPGPGGLPAGGIAVQLARILLQQ